MGAGRNVSGTYAAGVFVTCRKRSELPAAAQGAAAFKRRLAIAHFLIRLIVNAAALFFVVYVYPADSHVYVNNLTAAIIAGIVFGLINAIIRPILIVLSLPLIILTLGLFTLVVNAIVLWIVAALPTGLHVDGFGWTFIGALILSIVSFLLSHLVKEVEAERQTT